MLRSMKNLGSALVSLGFMAGFLWLAFNRVDLPRLWEAIRGSSLSWLVGCALLLVLSNFARAWRWRVLMAPLARDIGLWRTFIAVLVGLAVNNLLPRAGEFARVMALKQGGHVRITALMATVVVERVLDLVALIVLLGITLFMFRDPISSAFPWMEGAGVIALVVCLALLAAFGVLSACGGRVIHVVEKHFSRISPTYARRLADLCGSFIQGMAAVRTPRGYAQIAFSTVLIYASYVLFINYLPFLAFGFHERYGLGFNAALVVMTIGAVGMVLPSPGGVGTYHYFCSQTLHLLFGVPLPEALGFAVAVHGVIYVVVMLAGGPWLLGFVTSGLKHAIAWKKQARPEAV